MKISFDILKSEKFFYGLMTVVVIYMLFFYGLGEHKLLDADETRYITMAKDMFLNKEYMTLYLNGEYFFEKPPLFFWLVAASFKLFHTINEWSARVPVAFQAFLSALCVLLVGAKVVSKKFGIYSALILGTSLEFIMMSKIGMLDMTLAFCTTISTFLGFMTFFVKESNKKYFWWGFYLFSALGVLAKGIPGFVIPFGTMFFCGIYTKKLKEFFKPQYFLVGTLLFLLVALPWHILMFHKHDPLFYNEYIVKHHLARFLGADVIDRKRPFYYYFVTIAWGLFPWIFSFVALLIDKVKGFKYKSFDELTVSEKFVSLSVIGAVFTMLFFTSSGTKLVTYILPIYPFLAVILAQYLTEDGFSKTSKILNGILGGLTTLAGFCALIAGFVLPKQLYLDIKEAQFDVVVVFLSCGLLALYAIIKKSRKDKLFVAIVGMMIMVSAFCANDFFNVDYKFGQNDLFEYATYVKNNGHPHIIAYNAGKKYSLLYYSGATRIDLVSGKNIDELKSNISKNPDSVIVVRNKDMQELSGELKFEVIKIGRKYSLVKSK